MLHGQYVCVHFAKKMMYLLYVRPWIIWCRSSRGESEGIAKTAAPRPPRRMVSRQEIVPFCVDIIETNTSKTKLRKSSGVS